MRSGWQPVQTSWPSRERPATIEPPALSLPLTMPPTPASNRAKPLMPEPPTPTKWKRLETNVVPTIPCGADDATTGAAATTGSIDGAPSSRCVATPSAAPDPDPAKDDAAMGDPDEKVPDEKDPAGDDSVDDDMALTQPL